jgi:hypothetical protein
MRTTLFLILVLISSAANAGQAIQLPGLRVAQANATGACGAAKINITGIIHDDASGHDNVIAPGGKIVIRAKTKTLVVGEGGIDFMQDRTMLACVDTSKGQRLVLTTFCDGRSCPPSDYRVIDPMTLAVLSKSSDVDGCSLACAEKALGTRVPAPLADGLSLYNK